jgi:glutathione S-transferase
MTAEPATLLSAIVTIVALLVYFYMGFRVGAMRGKHNIKAPLMTGHPEMDRAVRVHMNTLEHIVVFIPLLWLATAYFHMFGWLPAAAGAVWIVGRLMYMQGYMADPDKRSTGFLISLVAVLALLIMAIGGIVQAWMAATAS